MPCEDILAQINAVKSALHKVGQVVLEGHIQHCVRDGIEHGDADQTIAQFTKAVAVSYTHLDVYKRQLVHTGTSLVEHVAGAVDTGLFVDIFPFDGLPEKDTPEYDRHWKKLLFLEKMCIRDSLCTVECHSIIKSVFCISLKA